MLIVAIICILIAILAERANLIYISDSKTMFVVNKTYPLSDTAEKDVFLTKLNKEICEKHNIETPRLVVTQDPRMNAEVIIIEDSYNYLSFESGLMEQDQDILSVVLAHELRHVKKYSRWSPDQTAAVFKHILFIVFSILTFPSNSSGPKGYSLLFLLMGLSIFSASIISYYLNNLIMRIEEYNCDIFSARVIGLDKYLKTAQFFDNYQKEKNQSKNLLRILSDEYHTTHPSWKSRMFVVTWFIKISKVFSIKADKYKTGENT